MPLWAWAIGQHVDDDYSIMRTLYSMRLFLLFVTRSKLVLSYLTVSAIVGFVVVGDYCRDDEVWMAPASTSDSLNHCHLGHGLEGVICSRTLSTLRISLLRRASRQARCSRSYA